MKFTSDVRVLNAADPFGSAASGAATVTLESPTATTRTVRVQIDVSGLEVFHRHRWHPRRPHSRSI